MCQFLHSGKSLGVRGGYYPKIIIKNIETQNGHIFLIQSLIEKSVTSVGSSQKYNVSDSIPDLYKKSGI